jgi:hypothetical protein
VGALKQSLVCIFFLNFLFFKIIWCCIVELAFPFPWWTQLNPASLTMKISRKMNWMLFCCCIFFL